MDFIVLVVVRTVKVLIDFDMAKHCALSTSSNSYNSIHKAF